MNELVKVRVLRAHINSFGDAHEKAEGEQYALPSGAAALLINEKLVEAVADGDENAVRGRQGTGKGAGADRKGGDAEKPVEAGA